MLLSDQGIRAALDVKRIALEPYDPTMLQPSSIDIRLDRYFRVFENHRYPHIDPSMEQADLTRLVETTGNEAFVLHPGEFVLASTYELVTLGDDVAARLEGKALAIDTPIPTPEGWRAMADLGPGDLVFDQSGARCAVVAVTDVMTGRPCREVEFSDGTTVIADVQHRWYTVAKSDRSHGRRPGRLRTTGEIAETLRIGDEWRHHIPLADPVQYPVRELPIDPYVLGVWLGDDTSTKAEITVGGQDQQILREIEAAGYAVWRASAPYAYRIGGLSPDRVGRIRDTQGRYAGDGSLSSSLRVLGLLGHKKVPEIYLQACIEQRLALLQGLMDSDGYVDVYGRCEFLNTNEQIADSVVILAASLGLRPKKRKKRAMLNGVDCGPAYQVKFTPRLPVFRLRRKLARLKCDDRVHAFRAIVDVRQVASVPVRCVQVSSPSGLFLVSPAYISTHNSSLGRLGLLTHSTAGFIDPGFTGHVTLELSNVATLPIKLWPGMKIGQLCFFDLSSPAEHPYGSQRHQSRYQGQRGPTPSRSYLNFDRTEI